MTTPKGQTGVDVPTVPRCPRCGAHDVHLRVFGRYLTGTRLVLDCDACAVRTHVWQPTEDPR